VLRLGSGCRPRSRKRHLAYGYSTGTFLDVISQAPWKRAAPPAAAGVIRGAAGGGTVTPPWRSARARGGDRELPAGAVGGDRSRLGLIAEEWAARIPRLYSIRWARGAGGKSGRELGVGRVDLQSPRECGRQSEEFMVEVVAEPAEGLGDQHCRGERIGEGPEANPMAPTADVGADRAAEQRTMEGVPAVPDREDVPQVDAREEVIPEVREHVMEPSPDDPDQNADRIAANRQRTRVELRTRVGGLGILVSTVIGSLSRNSGFSLCHLST